MHKLAEVSEEPIAQIMVGLGPNGGNTVAAMHGDFFVGQEDCHTIEFGASEILEWNKS